MTFQYILYRLSLLWLLVAAAYGAPPAIILAILAGLTVARAIGTDIRRYPNGVTVKVINAVIRFLVLLGM